MGAYFQEQLEKEGIDLAGLGDSVIEKAQRLARDALRCLHQHHLAVRMVTEVVSDLLEQVAYRCRIKFHAGLTRQALIIKLAWCHIHSLRPLTTGMLRSKVALCSREYH